MTTIRLASLTTSFICIALTVRSAQAAAPRPDWHEQVVYQVFPKSFADTDGDGQGDIRGVLAKVGYLKDLGVDVVWLNPVYKSTHFDSGYDVTDYLDIDPQFGTLGDLYALRDALHARGMRLMMDIVLNHSSDEHPWFAQEMRLKTLQREMTRRIAKASRSDAEQLVNMLGDPASLAHETAPAVREGQALVDAYMNQDDSAAVAAGYPHKLDSLQALGRALAPCAESPAQCPGVARPFDDFYIWRDKPNNWTGIFSGSAWHPAPSTGGYFMSLFSIHQIDLNWRNPRLRQAMQRIVGIWDSRGIDGLRLDSIGTLSKEPTFPNAAPKALGSTGRGIEYFTHLPPVHRYMKELSAYYPSDFRSIGEVAFTREHPHAPIDYAGRGSNEMNEVFVFEQMGIDCNKNKWRKKPFVVRDFKEAIDDQQALIHGKAWLGNYFENHDQMRIVSRYGNAKEFRTQSAKLFGTLLMTLEGTPYIYQGQELGMTDLPESVFKKVDDVQDIEARNYYAAQVAEGEAPAKVFHEIATRCRDHVRSAMQWSGDPGAGFTKNLESTSVRINDNHKSINAAEQLNDPSSILRYYQSLIKTRRQHRSWVDGKFTDILPDHPQVFAFTRVGTTERTVVLLNIGDTQQSVTLPQNVTATDAVNALTDNYGDAPKLQSTMTLRPWEAVVFVVKTAVARNP